MQYGDTVACFVFLLTSNRLFLAWIRDNLNNLKTQEKYAHPRSSTSAGHKLLI